MVAKLQERFVALAGGELVHATPGRGSELKMTEAGKRVREMCEDVLTAVYRSCRDLKVRSIHPTLRIGLSRFMIQLLGQIDRMAEPKIKAAGWTLSRVLYHISSDRVQEVVKTHEVDFCLGGILVSTEHPTELDDDLDFVKLKDEALGLLASYDTGPVTGIEDLWKFKVPLIIPTRGVVHELLNKGLDPGKYKALNIVEYSNDAYFSLDTIQLPQYHAAMIATQSMYALVADRSRHIHFKEFKDCPYHLEIGLIRRKHERETLGQNHPLRILWDAFDELVRSQSQSDALKG
jgi:DNA-binding transcriptional LysR family regulator